MGFLSDVWKGIKNVVKGIGKVFKAILKPIAKVLNSSWGKALMLGLSIFTFGGALLAGVKGFAQTTGSFLTKFVQGGKDFVGALIGKGGADTVSGAGEAAAELGTEATVNAALPGVEGMLDQTVQTAGNLVSGANTAAEGGNLLQQGAQAANAIGSASNASGPTQALADVGGNLATRTPPGAESFGSKAGGWLKDAGKNAINFINENDNLMNLVGGAMQGYGQAAMQEDMQEHQARYDRMWMDPNNPGVQGIGNFDFNKNVPANWPTHQFGEYGTAYGYTPTVPFRRPVGE